MDGGECPDGDRGAGVMELAAEGESPTPGVIQDFVDGYLVPVDPMDELQCEGCQ